MPRVKNSSDKPHHTNDSMGLENGNPRRAVWVDKGRGTPEKNSSPEEFSRGRNLGQAPNTHATSHFPPRNSTIRLSGPIERDNIVNGPGLRVVIWTQGCRQHCPGCQNPETWDEKAGTLTDIEEVKNQLRALKGQTGLTFCGGEPLLQPEACLEISTWAKRELGWNVWSFTGLIFEKLPSTGPVRDFVNSLDALIDGPFILSQRDLTLKWRGSKNQRLLHLKNGEITSIE